VGFLSLVIAVMLWCSAGPCLAPARPGAAHPFAWLQQKRAHDRAPPSPQTPPLSTPPDAAQQLTTTTHPPPGHHAALQLDAPALRRRRHRGAQGGGLRPADGRQPAGRGAGGAVVPGDAAELQRERALSAVGCLQQWGVCSSSTSRVLRLRALSSLARPAAYDPSLDPLPTNPPPTPTPTPYHPPNKQIPVALATPLPERRLRPALDRLDLSRTFAAVITAEDNASPELETTYLAAAHQLRRPPLRCVVLGDSNRSVEAAHELGMKSVVVTGGQPAWNFGGADLVVRGLGQLTFVNLKKLFAQEDLVEPHTPWEEIQASKKRQQGGAGGADDGFDDDSTSLGSYGGGWSEPADADADAGSSSLSSSSGSWVRFGSSRRSERSGEREPALTAASLGESEFDLPPLDDPREDEEDFEVVMPPKGAAFWDL